MAFDESYYRAVIPAAAEQAISSAIHGGQFAHDRGDAEAQYDYRVGLVEAEREMYRAHSDESVSRGQLAAQLLGHAAGQIFKDRKVQPEARCTENVRRFCGLLALTDIPVETQYRLARNLNGIFDGTEVPSGEYYTRGYIVGDYAEEQVRSILNGAGVALETELQTSTLDA